MAPDRTSLAGTPPSQDTADVYAEPSSAGLDAEALEEPSPQRMRELLSLDRRARRMRAGSIGSRNRIRQAPGACPASVGHGHAGVAASPPRAADPGRDDQSAPLRPRDRQPALQGDRVRFQFTTREAVLRFGEHLRLHPVKRGAEQGYTYEREVEEFLRWSPHVRRERKDEEPLGL